MKKLSYILALCIGILGLQSCEDYSAYTPEIISAKIKSQTPDGDNTIVELVIKAKAENLVIWWGDTDSNYELYKELIAASDTGRNVTKTYPTGEAFAVSSTWDGETPIPHTYESDGIYSLVLIASSNGNFAEENIQEEFKLSVTVE